MPPYGYEGDKPCLLEQEVIRSTPQEANLEDGQRMSEASTALSNHHDTDVSSRPTHVIEADTNLEDIDLEDDVFNLRSEPKYMLFDQMHDLNESLLSLPSTDINRTHRQSQQTTRRNTQAGNVLFGSGHQLGISANNDRPDAERNTKMKYPPSGKLRKSALKRNKAGKKSFMKIENRKKISFSSVQIREYFVVLGDHPCCMHGPPLSLGWDHTDTEVLDINHYEGKKTGKRTRGQLRLSAERRQRMLFDNQDRSSGRSFVNHMTEEKVDEKHGFFFLPREVYTSMASVSTSMVTSATE